jgi:hypothetical protein
MRKKRPCAATPQPVAIAETTRGRLNAMLRESPEHSAAAATAHLAVDALFANL